MNSGRFSRRRAPVAIDPAFDQQWQIRGVADMNGDSKPDLVWQRSGNGQLAAWLFDGTARIGTPNLGRQEPDLNWRVNATLGDGRHHRGRRRPGQHRLQW